MESVSRLLRLNAKYPLANVMLGQLFLEQKMTDSAVALARRAVAAGEDPKTWGAFLLRPTQESVRSAQAVDAEAKKDSTNKDKMAAAVAAWQSALDLSQETDKLSPSATSKFFVGITSFQVGYAAVNGVQAIPAAKRAKDPMACSLAKKAQDEFVLTMTNMPAGGSVDPATAQQILGFVNQMSGTVEQMVKAYCK